MDLWRHECQKVRRRGWDKTHLRALPHAQCHCRQLTRDENQLAQDQRILRVLFNRKLFELILQRHDGLNGIVQHHGGDHHAKNLHATARHPEHEQIHWQRLQRRHGHFASAFQFQFLQWLRHLFSGGRRILGRLQWRLILAQILAVQLHTVIAAVNNAQQGGRGAAIAFRRTVTDKGQIFCMNREKTFTV